MNFKSVIITEEDVDKVLSTVEDHFNDVKSIRIEPGKLSQSISSFANTSGGDIYVGIVNYILYIN